MTYIRHDSLPYVGINRIRFQGSGNNFPSQLLKAPPANIIEFLYMLFPGRVVNNNLSAKAKCGIH